MLVRQLLSMGVDVDKGRSVRELLKEGADAVTATAAGGAGDSGRAGGECHATPACSLCAHTAALCQLSADGHYHAFGVIGTAL
jgi:hypothetical protein